jgi:hypothetical protein
MFRLFEEAILGTLCGIMEDGYEQTLFKGRGKTMHRIRRNDQLIFFMSQKKRELLYD